MNSQSLNECHVTDPCRTWIGIAIILLQEQVKYCKIFSGVQSLEESCKKCMYNIIS